MSELTTIQIPKPTRKKLAKKKIDMEYGSYGELLENELLHE